MSRGNIAPSAINEMILFSDSAEAALAVTNKQLLYICRDAVIKTDFIREH